MAELADLLKIGAAQSECSLQRVFVTNSEHALLKRRCSAVDGHRLGMPSREIEER